MKNIINKLVYLSNIIGARADFVQGGGGNISIKDDLNVMYIKASGFCLKDVNQKTGFSIVDFKNIQNAVDLFDISNEEFDSFTISQTIDSPGLATLKPSIETGFHAILKKVVIHTHSIYANLLTCSEEGEELSKILFPNSIWVKYKTPGKELTFEIADQIKNIKPSVLFLKNHGIIVTDDSPELALELHEHVNKEIIKYFDLENKFKLYENNKPLEFIRDNILFPDQIVYTQTNETMQSIAAAETLSAYSFILDSLSFLEMSPSFLNNEVISQIANMESEKFRKELIK